MSTQRIDVLFPVGRMVAGSLYKPQTQDAEGKPLVNKSGPNVGQPREDYFFAVAIPKNPGETSWQQTVWGQKIVAAAQAGFPNGAFNAPTFAWKVKDGDSQVPNRKGKKPCDQVGYRGNWIVYFSSGFATKVYNRDGSAPIVEADAVKCGYFVQVFGSVGGNGSVQQPGVFINHSMVAFAGYGEEIVMGPDASSVGFGQTALPAGATTAPVGGMTAAPVTTMPAAPVAPLPMPVPAAAPVPVVPVAVAPVPIVPPPVVPAPAARRLTEKAQGNTYEALITAGWTDETLVAHGLMLPY